MFIKFQSLNDQTLLIDSEFTIVIGPNIMFSIDHRKIFLKVYEERYKNNVNYIAKNIALYIIYFAKNNSFSVYSELDCFIRDINHMIIYYNHIKKYLDNYGLFL